MKPTLFDILEDPGRWEDMKGDDSDKICEDVKQLLMDIPAIPKPNDVRYLNLCHQLVVELTAKMQRLAEPYIEDLADEQSKDLADECRYGVERFNKFD